MKNIFDNSSVSLVVNSFWTMIAYELECNLTGVHIPVENELEVFIKLALLTLDDKCAAKHSVTNMQKEVDVRLDL